MRKGILSVMLAIMIAFASVGCTNTASYHMSSDKEWLQEQVQKGVITVERAKQIQKKL